MRLEADLPAEKIRLLQLADNKIAEMSEWDFPELEKTLDELQAALDENFPDLHLDDFGFTKVEAGDIDSFFEDVGEEAAKKEKEPVMCTCPECGHVFELPE